MQQSSNTSQGFILPLATLVAIIAAFAVNVWSNLFPLGGLSIGEISNTFFKDVLIIPANYAFAIWGLIYLGLFTFGIYQILPSQRNNPYLRKAGLLIIIASIAQIAWVYLFLSRMFVLSVVAMLVILVSLIGAVVQLRSSTNTTTRGYKWYACIPISIYLGWISVATIVNVASALVVSNWNGWGISPTTWTIIMVLVATILASFMTTRYQDIPYSGVTIWALIAIAIRQSNNIALLTVAISCAIACLIVIIMQVRSLNTYRV
ncbi:MAG: tryptophan-rich sensory protein [Calothrix sp. C42_A2020_038]|nr:tryptophan-rich sensory protein [Calothrix sp. C42_A2020_038]